MSLATFTTAYIECALWSSDDDNGQPLDQSYGPDDLAPDSLKTMEADCKAFYEEMSLSERTEINDIQAGRDFWLTRNRHGAGFWDGDYDETFGKEATDASHAYGSQDLYVGDNGMIYCC